MSITTIGLGYLYINITKVFIKQMEHWLSDNSLCTFFVSLFARWTTTFRVFSPGGISRLKASVLKRYYCNLGRTTNWIISLVVHGDNNVRLEVREKFLWRDFSQWWMLQTVFSFYAQRQSKISRISINCVIFKTIAPSVFSSP